jgi:hypothetical protein
MWTFSFSTIDILVVLLFQSENLMLAEKHRIEKEQNNQLRDQISRLLEVEQEQKIKMHERDLTIQSLQVSILLYLPVS